MKITPIFIKRQYKDSSFPLIDSNAEAEPAFSSDLHLRYIYRPYLQIVGSMHTGRDHVCPRVGPLMGGAPKSRVDFKKQ